jgi:long-chain fatty acid transport protein
LFLKQFRFISFTCFLILLLAGGLQICQAGGIYITQIATPGSVGTAGVSNVVNNIDASSVFTNPAGMTGLTRDEIVVGSQLVIPVNRFDSSVAEAGGSDGGNAGIVTPIPAFYGVKVLSDRWRVGFSLVAPLGGGLDYGKDFVGRYQATRSVLGGLGITPAVAFKITDKLSIGVGISALKTVLDLDVAVNQPLFFKDGQVNIDKIDDWSWQAHVGITYQLNDRTLLGCLYRSKSEIELEGDLSFKNIVIPPLNLTTSRLDKAKVDFDYAQVFQVGLRYDLTPNLHLFTDFDYETWSDFSNTRIGVSGGGFLATVQTFDRDFKDTWHLGVGLAYQKEKNIYACGTSYDSSPVNDSKRTADLPIDEQIKFSFAYGRVHTENLAFGFGLTYMYMGDGKIDQVAQRARYKGEFETNSLFFLSASLDYRF